MAKNKVSPVIMDGIANTNIEVLGNAPAVAVAQVYQVLAHSIGLSMQSAQANYANQMSLGDAVTQATIKQITGKP